jgi:hypothetical protein
MSSAYSTELANVVLFLANFAGTKDILKLSNNVSYQFHPPSKDPGSAWLGGISPEPKAPILCLAFNSTMFSPEGWVAGSSDDTDIADLQLAADNLTGVSKRHFRIDIHPLSHCPRVTVMSRSLQLVVDGNRVILTNGEEMEIKTSAIFDLGGIEFQAWRPRLQRNESQIYRRKALKLLQDAVQATPRYFPSIRSGPETLTSNVRYGRGDMIYIYRGQSGKGASASVMLVEERNSGKIFAAKEPYYKLKDNPGIRKSRWEELNREFSKLSALDHVSPTINQAFQKSLTRSTSHIL